MDFREGSFYILVCFDDFKNGFITLYSLYIGVSQVTALFLFWSCQLLFSEQEALLNVNPILKEELWTWREESWA